MISTTDKSELEEFLCQLYPGPKYFLRSSHKILVTSHYSEDLHTFSWEDLLKNLERFERKNL